MEKAVAYIEDEKIDSKEELRDTIGKVKSLLGLSRFALVDKDNIVYTQYTTYTGICPALSWGLLFLITIF